VTLAAVIEEAAAVASGTSPEIDTVVALKAIDAFIKQLSFDHVRHVAAVAAFHRHVTGIKCLFAVPGVKTHVAVLIVNRVIGIIAILASFVEKRRSRDVGH